MQEETDVASEPRPGVFWLPADELLNNPVVGIDVYPRPQKHLRDGPRSPTLAWLMLNAAACVRQDVEEGRRPNPIILHLDAPPSVVPDMAREWRWKPGKAKRFVRDLEGGGLIVEELAAALLAKIGSVQRKQKRPALPSSTRSAVFAKTNGRCVYCGVVLTMRRDLPNSYHADHLFPARDGGSDDPALLVPACAGCNQKKGARTLVEFIGSEPR